MKSNITNWAQLGLIASVTTLSVACGSKSSSSPSPAPTPAAPTASSSSGLTGSPAAQPADDQTSNQAQTPIAPVAPVAPVTPVTPVVAVAPAPAPVTPPVVVVTPTPAPAPAPAPAPIVIGSSAIGNFYNFTTPAAMHVQEWSDDLSISGTTPNLLQVSTLSDPTYSLNNACDYSNQLTYVYADPSGNAYKYCSTTGQNMRWANSGTNYSPEHVRLGANANAGSASPLLIEINLYRPGMASNWGPHSISNGGYDPTASLFHQLCVGASSVVTPSITVMDGFWGNDVNSRVFSCQTNLSSAPGQVSTVFVGSFYIGSSGTDLPAQNCWGAIPGQGQASLGGTCGVINAKNLLEVTVIAESNGQTIYDFDQSMQLLFKANLQQLVPLATH